MKAFRGGRLLHSFQTRMLLVSIGVMLLTLFVSTQFLFQRYETNMVSQIRESTLQSFSVAGAKIDNILNSARETANDVQSSKEVEQYLFSSYATPAERIRARCAVFNTMKVSFVSNGPLNALFFFRDNGTLLGATRNWCCCMENRVHPLFETLQAAGISSQESVVWLGSFRASDFAAAGSTIRPDTELIIGAYMKKYRYSFADSLRHVITCFSVSPDALRSCFDVLEEGDQELFLLDAEGRQLIGPDIAANGQTPWFYNHLDGAKETLSIDVNHTGGKYQLLAYRLDSSGWMLAKIVPYESYHRTLSEMKAFNWQVSLTVLLLLLLPYISWMIHQLHPFKSIGQALEKMQHGDLSVRLKKAYSLYEFELIRTEFNDMADSIAYLLRQTKDMEHQRLELELRNLQSQLNPHMIFNSISAIRWMAVISGSENISHMLAELTELIRPIFAEWRLTWPIGDELNYLSHYASLLRLRYGGSIEITIAMDDSLSGILLPCFTLQPLIENCVEHGIGDQGRMLIRIEGRIENGMLVITVADDGQGMPKDKLAKILKKIEAGDPSDHDASPRALGHTGIGLVNIHRRLTMFGGAGSGLTMQSTPGKGTTVTVRIPATEAQRMDNL